MLVTFSFCFDASFFFSALFLFRIIGRLKIAAVFCAVPFPGNALLFVHCPVSDVKGMDERKRMAW